MAIGNGSRLSAVRPLRRMALTTLLISVHAAASTQNIQELVGEAMAGDATATASLVDLAQRKKEMANGWTPLTNVVDKIDSRYSRHLSSQDGARLARLEARILGAVVSQQGFAKQASYWQKEIVFQDDSLFKASRWPSDPGVTFKTERVGNYTFYDGNKPIFKSPFASSRALMAHGHPGVGPDGLPIYVCRFTVSDKGPYFEVDAVTLEALLHGIQKPLPKPGICHSLPHEQQYWKTVSCQLTRFTTSL